MNIVFQMHNANEVLACAKKENEVRSTCERLAKTLGAELEENESEFTFVGTVGRMVQVSVL